MIETETVGLPSSPLHDDGQGKVTDVVTGGVAVSVVVMTVLPLSFTVINDVATARLASTAVMVTTVSCSTQFCWVSVIVLLSLETAVVNKVRSLLKALTAPVEPKTVSTIGILLVSETVSALGDRRIVGCPAIPVNVNLAEAF